MRFVRRTLGVLLLAGCAHPLHTDVTVATIPSSHAPALGVATSARRAPSGEEATAPREAPPLLAGTWVDSETDNAFTIVVEGGHASVVAAVDEDDGERYDIQSSSYEDGVLSWTYFVPSTRRATTFTVVDVAGNEMRCSWRNSSGASGDEVLVRGP